MNNRRPGHLVVTLRPGAALAHVPNQLDCLLGASRRVGRIDGSGPVDRTLQRWGNGFRAALVFHARRSLGRVGLQHEGFDDLEESLGLSRVLTVELGEAEKSDQAVDALRNLAEVESAGIQMLTDVTLSPPAAAAPERLTWEEAWRPRERIRQREAQALEPGDERVRVAVLDTGVALGHPEFRRRLLAGYDSVNLGMGWLNDRQRLVGDSRGTDFTPRDDVGHGSHVAGVIAAHGWRMPCGGAGECLMVPIRVLAAAADSTRASGKRLGIGALEQIDAGLKVAVDLGADVCNLSLGTPEANIDPDGPRPHEQAVRYAAHHGCILVAAAGNSGKRERFFPAALDGVIAVGSVAEDGRRSPFSTWGDHLALCAPGERIISTGRRGYQMSSGTSHAAPFVTAAVALMLCRARRAGQQLNGPQVRKLLCDSAVPASAPLSAEKGAGARGQANGFHPETGHGLLDMAAALRRLDQMMSTN
jgi:subtilisin family serine protease